MPTTKEEIEKLAYQLWEKDGRPQGLALKHYYEAERIIRERQLAQTAPSPRAEQFQKPAPIAASEPRNNPNPGNTGNRNRRPPQRG